MRLEGCRRVPDARLWFVGPDQGYVDDKGRAWHIEEYLHDRLPGALESKQVEWLGAQPISNLARLRRKAMVSVVCSRDENLPFVLLETIALGCPIVAARVGGIPEILDGNTNGLLHRASDSEDLAIQIITLLNDPSGQPTRQTGRDLRPRTVSPETRGGTDCELLSQGYRAKPISEMNRR